MTIKSILACLVFNLGAFVHAQNTVSGSIKDSENVSLPFANIIIYESESKELVAGTVSSDEGEYQFIDVADGSYYISVSVLGFETKKSAVFQLPTAEFEIDFVMKEKARTLNEVVVKARRPVIRQTAEKLVVNFENSDMINTTLEDVVKKVPGIIMTNGKVSYAGQGNIRILINGKTTDYMDTESLLKDLPADAISKVEMIQQPGAEYDAEGSGPILNIILKKNVTLGTHGHVKTTMGYENRFEYGTGAAISSYKNKLNWQANAGYSKYTYRDDLLLLREVGDQTYSQSSKSPYDPVSVNFGGGLDYYLTNAHTFGVSARRIENNSDRITTNETTIQSDLDIETLRTDNSFDRERVTYSLNPYYEFKNENNKLVLDYNFVNYTYQNENNLFKTAPSSIAYNNQRYFQEADFKINTYKADYKRTFSDAITWSSGAKFSKVNSDSDLQSFTQDDMDVFQFEPLLSNRFLVDESIVALYSKMNVKMDKWNFSGGLRWEESDTKGTSTVTNETRTRKISKFFPSASLGRTITDEIAVNLAYSYRIRRPSYSSLNSFVYYYDPYTFEEGNPNLKPAFTHSYQFSLTYENQPFFKVSYRETSDQLFEMIAQNDTSATTSRSMINLASNKNWSFSLFAPLNVIKGLDGYAGIIANHNQYTSKNLLPVLDLSKWSVTWFASAEYEIPWEINAELSGYYTSGGLEGIIDYDWLAGMEIAISKTFLDDKLKVSLEYEEILERSFMGTVVYDNVNAKINSDWARHNVFLQLKYSFGSKFGKDKNRVNSSKDEQDRIKNNN